MKSQMIGLLAAVMGIALPVFAPAKPPVRDVACRIEIDRGVLPAERNTTAVVKVTLDAPPPPEKHERPPVNLCIVLDRSGSMSGQKIEKAKEAAIEAVRRLGKNDMVSLVMFDHEVETVVPAQSAANSEWIESRIREITARGNTALFGGVSQGASEVRKNSDSKYVSRIILLSDGQANVGPSTPDDLGRLGASLLKEGIAVTTVGVGTDYNEDLMTKLAQKSDGNTYFVENSKDLPRIFNAELGDVLSVVARRVKIIIECADGVRPVRIIGREGAISGNTVELYLNQLYGGQEKFALIEVSVPETKTGKTRDIAKAHVSYNNSITQRDAESSALVQARFSHADEEVQKSINAPVQIDVARNAEAEAKDRAVELSDGGKHAEAGKVLSANAALLRAQGQVLNAPALVKEADELDKQAVLVGDSGYDNVGRKGARADSYQTTTQQRNK